MYVRPITRQGLNAPLSCRFGGFFLPYHEETFASSCGRIRGFLTRGSVFIESSRSPHVGFMGFENRAHTLLGT